MTYREEMAQIARDLELIRELAKQIPCRKWFDPKCYELAEHFMPAQRSNEVSDLAAEIQDAIEEFLNSGGGSHDCTGSTRSNHGRTRGPSRTRVADQQAGALLAASLLP